MNQQLTLVSKLEFNNSIILCCLHSQIEISPNANKETRLNTFQQ